jgi:hypothetical protein
VEFVEGDFGFGEVVFDAFDVGRGHVDADLFDARGIRVVVVDMFREPSDRICIFAFGDIDDLPGVDAMLSTRSGVLKAENGLSSSTADISGSRTSAASPLSSSLRSPSSRRCT